MCAPRARVRAGRSRPGSHGDERESPIPQAHTPELAAYARRLTILFGLVYFAQGFGQHVGLVQQPIQNYFKAALGLDAAQTTQLLAVVTIPWTLKPLYGLVSDFIPLAGYRRKTWLLLVNALAAAGFLWLSGLTTPGAIVTAMVLTAFGTAASDVIIDSLMVENGKLTGRTAEFQSVQWLWISIAGMLSALLGGWLCTIFAPGTALHVAAVLTMLAPLSVMVASWLIVREERSQIRLAEMKATSRGLWQAVQSRTLWAVIAFIAFWNFSPGFGTPWYYHMSDNLKFSQAFIGMLGAVENGGAIIGALVYWRWLAKLPLRRQLQTGILLGTGATLLYLLLVTPTAWSQAIAIVTGLLIGAAAMAALLALLTLSAQACPARAEGFTFAALMAVNNGVTQISQIIGARLYNDTFQKNMLPLILLSAALTAACFLVLPILDRAKLAQDGAR